MPVTSVTSDPEALTLTVVADFTAPLERLWDAYADPRLIERFWGPPTYPARFTRHDMVAGGRSEYTMTGPDGTTSSGYWEFLAVDPPRSFAVRDGFASADGTAADSLPSMQMVFAFSETPSGSRLTTTTVFDSADDLEKLLAMGMDEGMRSAMAQIDDVLADLAAFAGSRGTDAQVLSDTRVRLSRVVRGSVEQVWRAHHDPDLLRRWMLGPDGWTMPVCEVATAVGAAYRYEWESAADGSRFGFTGTLVESQPPRRAVTTESMLGQPSSTLNELTLTPWGGGTLVSMVITYPDAGVRDRVLATGMVDGVESSYARLERELLVDV